jgi:hypothetical protein
MTTPARAASSASSASFSASPGSVRAAAGAETSPAEGRLARLDALLHRSTAELQALYEGARTPRIGDVEGDLRGRMLAWPSLDAHPKLAAPLRAFAGSQAFPWRGKSFRPKSESRGVGINRVVADRLRLFRFDTFIGRSRAGDFDALQLDYDVPGNPPVIRSIKDEIRELEAGLWLGQAWLKTSKREILWLYFALAKADG